jgi:hypothetical protein
MPCVGDSECCPDHLPMLRVPHWPRDTRADHPLMFWINLPFTVLPFPQIELQGLGAMNKRAAGARTIKGQGAIICAIVLPFF